MSKNYIKIESTKEYYKNGNIKAYQSLMTHVKLGKRLK